VFAQCKGSVTLTKRTRGGILTYHFGRIAHTARCERLSVLDISNGCKYGRLRVNGNPVLNPHQS